ncbi:beta-N-acetylhexosaminidase family protein [Pedobacter lusitanus]|uniref:hypothetical protein n=1 Tax=Pedobacter lusitanus TaxID=1503925 RepID=UPI001269FFF9|nr:hypothetical protein [Pedobacter lusitanus]
MKGVNKLAMLCVLLLCCLSMKAQFNIIPQPGSLKENGDKFTITKETKIYYEKGLKQQAELLFFGFITSYRI